MKQHGQVISLSGIQLLCGDVPFKEIYPCSLEEYWDAKEQYNYWKAEYSGETLAYYGGDWVNIWLQPQIVAVNAGFQYIEMANSAKDSIEYGMGSGWEFNLPWIETRMIGDEDIFSDINYETYLHLADGRRYHVILWQDHKEITGYKHHDMWFENRATYDGAQYTLSHKDGRKEHFDGYGRCMAIQDKYGNTIKIEYEATSFGLNITQMKITDTHNNIILYKQEAVSGTQYLDGVSGNANRYNKKYTLSLNGQIVRQYYRYDASSPYYTQSLIAAKDENGENMRYEYLRRTVRVNSLVAKETAYDTEATYNALYRATNPNGYYTSIDTSTYSSSTPGAGLPKRRLEWAGFACFPTAHWVAGNLTQPSIENYLGKRYAYEDPDGFDARPTYETKVQEYFFCRSSERVDPDDPVHMFGYSKTYTIITFTKYNNARKTEKTTTNSYVQYDPPKSDAEWYNHDWTDINVSETSFEYDEDTYLPKKTTQKLYNTAGTSVALTNVSEYTYDNYANLLTEKRHIVIGCVVLFSYTHLRRRRCV